MLVSDHLTGDAPVRTEISEGSWLLYVRRFVTTEGADRLYEHLARDTPWDTNVEGAFGRPRRTYWVGERAYAYSGVVHHPAPWTPALLSIRTAVERLSFGESQGQFGGVLMNHYRSGADSIGMHADNEATIEPESPIASISLGAERTFILVPRRKRVAPETPQLPLRLAHGSCLIMCGRMQLDWRHGIPAEPAIEGGRVNLTFRKYVSG